MDPGHILSKDLDPSNRGWVPRLPRSLPTTLLLVLYYDGQRFDYRYYEEILIYNWKEKKDK